MLSMDVVPASKFEFFTSFANRAGRNLRSCRNQYVVAAYLRAMHTGICTRTAHAPFAKHVNHVRSSHISIKHAPPLPHLNYAH